MTEHKNDSEKQVEKQIEKQEGVPHLVTPLHPIANQVGEHILHALEVEETVAVLTTVTGSKNGQQVVSIPLTGDHLQKVHGLIAEIHESNEPERIPCVGFHCYVDSEKPEEEK
ncbi:MAG: hypothetical protein H8E86_05680 [Planctomycetes bacterium]|nr:hypothetical protein [Planctomycetota bacterium]